MKKIVLLIMALCLLIPSVVLAASHPVAYVSIPNVVSNKPVEVPITMSGSDISIYGIRLEYDSRVVEVTDTTALFHKKGYGYVEMLGFSFVGIDNPTIYVTMKPATDTSNWCNLNLKATLYNTSGSKMVCLIDNGSFSTAEIVSGSFGKRRIGRTPIGVNRCRWWSYKEGN